VLFANIIAWAEEHSFSVSNYTFQSYANFFRSTRHTSSCSYPKRKKPIFFQFLKPLILFTNYFRLQYQVVYFFSKILFKIKFLRTLFPIISDQDFEKVFSLTEFNQDNFLKGNRFVFISGWKFREPSLTLKHRDKIKDFFSLTSQYQNQVSNLTKHARIGCELLVGLHVRRGDYAVWKGGKYFYELENYHNFMEQIITVFSDQNVGFLVCSNETLDTNIFCNFNITMSRSSAIVDLYSLSDCDLIIGPPSTYTQWASYFGGKPLCHVYSVNESITKDSFSVVNLDTIPG
jgi:hypothetical protein